MKKLPEVLFVVDGVYEKQAVKEGKSLNIDTFAILNTNGDDKVLTDMIPANTNSVKSMKFLADELKEALANVKIVRKTVEKKIVTKTVVEKKETLKTEETQEKEEK
jgi:ribosomal protein S2